MPKVYLDETGFDTFYYRPYAYALRGQIVKARISGKRYERMSLVAARGDRELVAPMIYSGLNLNQYGVASPCRTICTVCGFVALS